MNGAIQTFVWFTLCSRNKGLKPQIYYKTHRSLCKWLSYYFKTRKHNMVVEIVFDCNNIFNYTYLGSLGYVNDFECQENHLCINIWEVRWILIRGTSSKNGKMNKKKERYLPLLSYIMHVKQQSNIKMGGNAIENLMALLLHL